MTDDRRPDLQRYLDRPLDDLMEELDLYDPASRGAADTLAELGKLLRDAGQMRQAIDAFNECAEIYRRTNNPAKLGIILEFMGTVHELQGQYSATLEKYQQALALFKQYASPQYVADTEQNIARVQANLQGGG